MCQQLGEQSLKWKGQEEPNTVAFFDIAQVGAWSESVRMDWLEGTCKQSKNLWKSAVFPDKSIPSQKLSFTATLCGQLGT